MDNMENTVRMMDNIINRRNAEYVPLIENFRNEVVGLNLKAITGPHFPGVGECYEAAKYKFAFCGMETYGWESMENFMEYDICKYLSYADNCLNSYKHLGWASNWHATFWGFVFKFLAKFYKTDFNELVRGGNNITSQLLLKSFVWGNANSIERYEVTSKCGGADFAAWETIKKVSKKIDDINHIINSCAPKVIFIIYSGASEEYMLNESTLSGIYGENFNQRRSRLKLPHNNPKYDYYYLRSSSTHVFHLPHPTWMGLYSGIGIDTYVDSLIKDIEDYQIWDVLPKSSEDWEIIIAKDHEKNSINNKFELVASIAHSLTKHNTIMYGGDLGKVFNLNMIPTQYGTPYSMDGGRGIYKVISSAYTYYYNMGDFQKAYEIARSFVKKNGEYAYD